MRPTFRRGGIVLIAAVMLASVAAPLQVMAAGRQAPAEPGSDPAPPELPVQAPAPPAAEVDDAQIESRLRAIFAEVDGLAGVQVEVNAGVVRLTGNAPSAELIDRVDALATGMPGVVFVDNQVRQPEAVAERIEPAIERLRGWWTGLVGLLPLLAIAIVILVVGWLLARQVRRWSRPFAWAIRNDLIREIVQQSLSLTVIIIALLLALELLDATALVGAVLGAAGIVGLTIGFAFRDIAENYLASLLLGARRPFSANDLVRIENHEGKVARLTMRETMLVTLEGNHVRLPNALVFKSVVVNYTTSPERRFDFRITVAIRADIAEAKTRAMEALEETAGVSRRWPAFAHVEEIGDAWVALRAGAWVDQRQFSWDKVRSEAMRRVQEALEAYRPPVLMPAFPAPAAAPPPPASSRSAGRRDESSRRAAPAPGGPARRRGDVVEAAAPAAASKSGHPHPDPAEDVTAETHIDQQVTEERARSPEQNLLDDDDPERD